MLGVVALATLANGCMTVDHLIDPQQKLRMYGGTTTSYDYIENASSPRFGVFVRIVDLPLTLVGDTLLLPITAPVESLRD